MKAANHRGCSNGGSAPHGCRQEPDDVRPAPTTVRSPNPPLPCCSHLLISGVLREFELLSSYLTRAAFDACVFLLGRSWNDLVHNQNGKRPRFTGRVGSNQHGMRRARANAAFADNCLSSGAVTFVDETKAGCGAEGSTAKSPEVASQALRDEPFLPRPTRRAREVHRPNASLCGSLIRPLP